MQMEEKPQIASLQQPSNTPPPPVASVSTGQPPEAYFVEKVLKKRVLKGVTQYLLKWQGYPESENSWEPIGVINSPRLIEEFEAKLKAKQDNKTARGFERGLEAEEIIGGTESGGKIKFLLKWKGVNQLELIECEEAADYCPELVLGFFQNRVSPGCNN